ncbi:MAG: hypothetical protein JNL01_00470 [Bdellovibrionales bacterium]|nr:hypothetical protein [Bdellovibrionales bacterium]
MKARSLILVGLILCTLQLVFAAWIHRPMMNDGSFWYFFIFHLRKPFWDITYVRWLDTLLQWPAVLFLRAFENRFEDITPIVSGMMSFAYSLHPMVSLGACWKILTAKKRMDLLAFPVLALALSTLPTLAFATGEAPDAISVFWPLFLLVVLRKPIDGLKDWANTLPILILTLALALSYEPAVFGFAVLVLVTALRIRDLKASTKSSRMTEWFLLALFSLGIFWLVYRAIGPTHGYQGNFLRSIKSTPQGLRVYGFILGAALIPSIGMAFLKKGGNRWTNGLLLSVTGGATIWMLYRALIAQWWLEENILGQAFDARTTALPMTALIAGLAIPLARRTAEFNAAFAQKTLDWVASVALGVAVINDFQVSLHWNRGVQFLKNYLEKNPGCTVLTREAYQRDFLKYGLAAWDLPHASVVLLNRRKANALVFADPLGEAAPKITPDYCGKFKKGMTGVEDLNIAATTEYPVPIAGPHVYWDLSPLIPKDGALGQKK